MPLFRAAFFAAYNGCEVKEMQSCLKILPLVMAGVIAFGGSASACTLWAAAGNVVEGGGTLIAKNRDWRPDHQQKLELVMPKEGYRYYGIYADNGRYKGLKAGINEKGLTVVSASASSIPRKERNQMKHSGAVLRKVLSQCATVEEAAALLSHMYGPQFLLLADRNEIAQVEIGPAGTLDIRIIRDGTLFHTNHYVAEDLSDFNILHNKSSHVRLVRIGDLLAAAGKPYTMETFEALSHDRHDGPDDSIERTGSSEKAERTLASWIVAIPREGAPHIHVRLMNPGAPVEEKDLSADDIF